MDRLETTRAANAGANTKHKQPFHFSPKPQNIKTIILRLVPFILAMGAFHV